MGPLRGDQQLEPVPAQLACGRQVDRAEAGEPAPHQDFQQHAENCEDQDTQQRQSVQRPRPRRPLSMTAQLVNGIAAATNRQRRLRRRLLSTQQCPLLNPSTRHAPRLSTATVINGRPKTRSPSSLPAAGATGVSDA